MNQAREQRKETLKERATELSRDIRFLETDIPQQQTMLNMLKTNAGGYYNVGGGLANIQQDRDRLNEKKRERQEIADELKAISRTETEVGRPMWWNAQNRLAPVRKNNQGQMLPANQHHQNPLQPNIANLPQ